MNQSGYSMIFGLFILLGISGTWVARNTAHERLHSGNQSLELALARSALISYATNYIDHYGAEGAGIGHLPCPDTDVPDPSHKDPWVRDGPNPPCSKNTVELGWLPRHVNTASGRYHFHTRQRQRLWYAVSGQYVNNPANRIVNPDSIGNVAIGGFNDIVAVLTSPPVDSSGVLSESWWALDSADTSSGSYAIIRTKDIRQPAMQRASEWLLTRLNAAAEQRCSNAEKGVACGYSEFAKHGCTFSAETEWLYWLSTHFPDLDCGAIERALSSQFTTIEDAPYARHWFVRNRWFDFVTFHLESPCLEELAMKCKFTVDPVVLSDRKMVFRLRSLIAED